MTPLIIFVYSQKEYNYSLFVHISSNLLKILTNTTLDFNKVLVHFEININ